MDINSILELSSRLLVAIVLGGIIGIEREFRAKDAGFRTHFLVSLGSALFCIVSQYGFGVDLKDSSRVAAQVVSGIGFLGAGTIIFHKNMVHGLTTAAGIWITAMIGLAVGAGMYIISIITTLLIIFILAIMNRYEHYADMTGESKIIRIKLKYIVTDPSAIKQTFAHYNVHISDLFLKYDYENNSTIINVIVRCKTSTNFIKVFSDIHADPGVTSITLSNEVNI